MSDKYNKEDPSLLQKIQNQTGCLLLVVGVAMLAFVLTDLIGSRNSILGGNSNSVGEIAGEQVSYDEYNSAYENMIGNVMRSNPNFELTPEIRESYKQQAWNQLVQQIIVANEYKKVGLEVSGEEMEDLTIGDNTHPQLKQAFTNPDDKSFDKARLVRYLREDIEANPEAKQQWLTYEQELITQIIADKYTKLIQSSFYVTELEAQNVMLEQDRTYGVNIVGISYTTIPDSTVSVSDAELRSYLKDHAYKYEQEASRDIEFVAFDVTPSREDTIRSATWANEIKERFAKAADDSLFVSASSEIPFDPEYRRRGDFSVDVENDIFNADTNVVLGPYYNSGVYSLFKVLAIKKDTVESVKASHILFRVSGSSDADTAKAVAEAREVLGKIRKGETTFADEAQEHNIDQTRSNGGNLGWIREKTYSVSQEFIDRAKATPEGEYFIVTTNKGVKLGLVTGAATDKMVQVAQLAQTVAPSTETDREYYRMAGEFLSQLQGEESFEEVAEKLGHTKRVSNKITEKDRRVAGINNGNIIARWLFDAETEQGDISDIIEVDNRYVVAQVTKIREKGLPELDEVRNDIEGLVKNQKKGEDLKKKFEAAMAKSDDQGALAKELNTIVTPIPDLSYSNGNLPYVGQDDRIVGVLFGTPIGSHTDILVGESGVYVGYVIKENEFTLPEDFEAKKNELRSFKAQGLQPKLESTLMKIGNVKDQRYKFYN